MIATMPFGKHKGTPLHSLPRDYIIWLLGNCAKIGQELRSALESQLDGSTPPDHQECTQCAAALALIAKIGTLDLTIREKTIIAKISQALGDASRAAEPAIDHKSDKEKV